jgi:hypothetical protein
VEGNVRRPEAGNQESDDEFLKARDDCRRAYEADQNTRAAAIDGIVGIYVRHFVNGSGTELPGTNGHGGYAYTTTGGANLCAEPPTGEFSLNATVMIEQSVRSLPDATQGALLGHEFGHALTLGHGNGRDDNGNNLVDAACDTAESDASSFVCSSPQTVMTPFRCFNSNGTHLEPIQIARSKAGALKIPMTVDPPDPVPGPVISDSRGDDVDDVLQEGIDLTTLTVAQNSATDNTLVAHQLFGDAPLRTRADYATFLDTDGNPATGGAPSSLGFDTTFQGAELVTAAQVRFHPSGEFSFQTVDPRVWKFGAGGFTEVTADPRISAGKDTMQGSHDPIPPVDMIWVRVPNDIRGPLTNPMRVQALTDGTEGGTNDPVERDRLPEAADGSASIFLIPPVYPTCSVSPDPVRPGAIATVSVSGLIPSEGAPVVFGADPIATGTTDAQGNGSFQFRIPPDSRLGFRLVTVGSDGTALTGDCSVLVEGAPVNLPPALTVPGTQTAQYSDPLTFGISATDLDNDPITLSASGLPSGLTFTDNGNGTGTVSGALEVAAGTYPVTFSASDGQNPAVTEHLNIVVTREDAVVAPSAINPTAVKVSSPGGTTLPVTLAASIVELADGSPGDISNAVPVTFTLTPTLTTGVRTCTAMTAGSGMGGTLSASCSFTSLPVDVYNVTIDIGGNFYRGSTEMILAVYDPSLGFVTGGGAVTHNGVRANFGFIAKYLKSGRIQGSVRYIEHRTGGNVALKSNAMTSLSVVGNSAVIVGKANLDGVGNHEFRVTAVDNGEPGTADRFGLQVRDRSGAGIASLTFAPILLDSGNIIVPHNSDQG